MAEYPGIFFDWSLPEFVLARSVFGVLWLETAFKYYGGLLHSVMSVSILVQPILLAVVFGIMAANLVGHRVFAFCDGFLAMSSFRVKVAAVLVCMLLIVALSPDLVPPFVYFSF